MKKILILLTIILLTSSWIIDGSCRYLADMSIVICQRERSFSIRGEKADQVLNSLIPTIEPSRKHFKHRLRNLPVNGFQQKFSLRIYEGIHGFDPEDGHLYFHTFSDREQKEDVIKKLTSNQRLGIVIYVKKSDGKKIETPEEAALFLDYLKQL